MQRGREWGGVCRGEKMESDPWELPVQAAVSHPTRRVEREVWFSARAANTQALSHPLSPFEGFKAEPPIHGADLPTTLTIPRNTAVVQSRDGYDPGPR